MGLGASLSGGSFPPPGAGGNITPLPSATTPPSNAAPPAPAPTAPPPAPGSSSFATTLSQVSTPLFTIVNGQIPPENLNQVMQHIPDIMSGLSPDEQDKFLQLLMTSDILDAMFGDLDRPNVRDSFNSIVRSLFDTGLFSQVAPDKAVLSEESQGALKDALQQKLVQTLVDASANPKNQPTTTQTPTTATTTPTPEQTTTGTSTTNPASPNPTSTGAETLTKLNIPVSQPGMPNQMPEAVASLVANSVTGALQQFLGSGAAAMSGNNPAATNAATPQNIQMANVLTSLIALGITSTPGGTLQLTIPTKTDAAGFQTQVDQLTQKLNQIGQEFSQLGDLATQNKWDIGPLKNFVSIPTTLLTLLKNVQPGDTTTTNMLKTWVDNSGIVNHAMLSRANDSMKDRFEFLKTITLASFTAAPALVKEQQARQMIFEQTLMQAPALLNVFKLKDMVGVFEEDIKRNQASLLFKYKRMLFNAAKEITIVASGKPTFEYNEVGIFHEQLEFLAQRIAAVLPPASDELDFDLMQIIANDINFTFRYIQEREPHRIKDLLKRHPRTHLYFLSSDSAVTADSIFPRSEGIIDSNDPTVLNMHFMRIMNVIKKYEKNSEFLKFQPKVLEAFVDEAKYDPTSEITKNSLKIVHKAVAESSDFIDLDSPD